MMTKLFFVCIVFTLLFVSSLQAATHNGKYSHGHYKNGRFSKHRELGGVDAKIIAVIKKLRRDQANHVRLIGNAKRRRDRARVARQRQLIKTRNAHAARLRKEGEYNSARAYEQRQAATLKVRESQHRAAQRAYHRQHGISTHAIRQLDAELKIMNKIRYLLGRHRITGWRKHRGHRGVRKYGNQRFRNYFKKGSTFHHGKQRFLKGGVQAAGSYTLFRGKNCRGSYKKSSNRNMNLCSQRYAFKNLRINDQVGSVLVGGKTSVQINPHCSPRKYSTSQIKKNTSNRARCYNIGGHLGTPGHYNGASWVSIQKL